MAAKKPPQASAWQRLGNAVKESREAQRLTQRQVGDRAGFSTQAVQLVESGHPFRRTSQAVIRTTEALGWPAGWWQAILDGKEQGAPAVAPPVVLSAELPDYGRMTIAELLVRHAEITAELTSRLQALG